jgi:hypothetical protein
MVVDGSARVRMVRERFYPGGGNTLISGFGRRNRTKRERRLAGVTC